MHKDKETFTQLYREALKESEFYADDLKREFKNGSERHKKAIEKAAYWEGRFEGLRAAARSMGFCHVAMLPFD